MTIDERSSRHLLRHLQTRHDIIVECWAAAIFETPLPAVQQAQIRAVLDATIRLIVDMLMHETFDRAQAQQIGYETVRHCPDRAYALSRTFEILGRELMAGMPSDLIALVHPRIVSLLSEMANGAIRHVQEALEKERDTLRREMHHELAQAKRHLQASERRFQTIFRGARIGIGLCSVSGSILESNEAFQQMVGYSADELATMTFAMLTHPDDIAGELELFAELVAGRRDQYRTEKRYICKDGHVVWGNLTASLVRDDDGATTYIIGMVEDITMRRQMVAKLALAHQRLAESQETERRRLAQELHDGSVQQLIGIVYQLTEDRQRTDDRSAAASEHVCRRRVNLPTVREQIMDVVSQLRSLIGELRPAGLDQLGLPAALEGYVARLRREQLGDSIRITLDLDARANDLPGSVAIALFRVAQEALRNAIQHADASLISISISCEADNIVLCVADNGRGMSQAAHLEYLTQDDHFGVIGMKERVASVEGELTIDSVPGGGTTVCACVPLAQAGAIHE